MDDQTRSAGLGRRAARQREGATVRQREGAMHGLRPDEQARAGLNSLISHPGALPVRGNTQAHPLPEGQWGPRGDDGS